MSLAADATRRDARSPRCHLLFTLKADRKQASCKRGESERESMRRPTILTIAKGLLFGLTSTCLSAWWPPYKGDDVCQAGRRAQAASELARLSLSLRLAAAAIITRPNSASTQGCKVILLLSAPKVAPPTAAGERQPWRRRRRRRRRPALRPLSLHPRPDDVSSFPPKVDRPPDRPTDRPRQATQPPRGTLTPC